MATVIVWRITNVDDEISLTTLLLSTIENNQKVFELTQYFSISDKAASISQHCCDLVGAQQWISLDGVCIAFRKHARVFDNCFILGYGWSTF
jgi:hypothetical protein